MHRGSLAAIAVFLSLAGSPAFGSDKGEDRDDRAREIIVNGQVIADTAVAAKADIPLLETSQAISIVSRETLDLQGVRRIGEALFNVAGVSRSNNYGFFDGFNIRGFNASAGATYLDGLLDDPGVAYATTELAGLERVEVVKGPASGLFGQGPLSGIVNLVSKRPQEEAFVEASVAAGSYNLWEAQLDVRVETQSQPEGDRCCEAYG